MGHTPGPWEVVDSPRIGPEIMAAAEQNKPLHERIRICHMRWTDGLNEQVEARLLANAHLIAAAPEMLVACQMAREELVFGGDWETARTKIEAAIARARGRP